MGDSATLPRNLLIVKGRRKAMKVQGKIGEFSFILVLGLTDPHALRAFNA